MVRDLEKVQVIILKLEQTSTFHKEMKKYQAKPKVCVKTIRRIRESSLEENQQSVFSSFSTKNGSLPVYSLSRYSACLQQITLILATSYSRQHFCFLAAKLRSVQLYRTENVFSPGCCLRCFKLSCFKTVLSACLQLVD